MGCQLELVINLGSCFPGLRDDATRLAVGRRPEYSLGPEPFGGTVNWPWSLKEEQPCLCTSTTVTSAEVT